MSKLSWGKDGTRTYGTGVSKGVAYPLVSGRYQTGVAFDGLTAVNENPSGGEPTKLYADNGVWITLMSEESYDFSIEGYKQPKGLSVCFGKPEVATGVRIGQQGMKPFGFTYRTEVGNDKEGIDYGYVIHLIFVCYATASAANHSTANNDPEAETHSWDVTTVPVKISDDYKTCKISLDSSAFRKAGLTNVLHLIEDFLYGTATTDPSFPKVSKLEELFETGRYLLDSSGEKILDSAGNPIESVVY